MRPGSGVDCRLARQLGFSGKLVIHPAQIAPVNEAFAPTPAEIEYAAKVVRAFDKAEAAGVAAVQLDGKFIDYPVAAWARRVLGTSPNFEVALGAGGRGRAPGGSKDE